jgi:hypothetical protein
VINKDPRMPGLNSAVTAAIFHAEDLRAKSWREFTEVSRLEEEIATICPAGTLEGDVARRGAITAALSANDPIRAHDLAVRYLGESIQTPGIVALLEEAHRLHESIQRSAEA